MDFNYEIGDEPEDIHITVKLFYNTSGHTVQNLVLQFKVIHSDSEVTGTIRHHTLRCRKQWLIDGDKAQIQAKVFRILCMIHVFHYPEIVERLTQEILDLRNPNVILVERVIMRIHFVTYYEYYESSNDDDDDDEVGLD